MVSRSFNPPARVRWSRVNKKFCCGILTLQMQFLDTGINTTTDNQSVVPESTDSILNLKRTVGIDIELKPICTAKVESGSHAKNSQQISNQNRPGGTSLLRRPSSCLTSYLRQQRLKARMKWKVIWVLEYANSKQQPRVLEISLSVFTQMQRNEQACPSVSVRQITLQKLFVSVLPNHSKPSMKLKNIWELFVGTKQFVNDLLTPTKHFSTRQYPAKDILAAKYL